MLPASLAWPLMRENVTRDDLDEAINFLSADPPARLTHGRRVEEFEEKFAQWLGSKFAVMVNSGASANIITLQALAILHGRGRVQIPCITWVSDIAAVLHARCEPIFVDIDPCTLGMDMDRAVAVPALAAFVTHCLGFPALQGWHNSDKILLEDCCEATGANVNGRKLGTLGLMSNFSFYYAHHMSTVEGGMVCTNDVRVYELLRMLRSHGLVREMKNPQFKLAAALECPDLDPEFIFAHPAYNMRPTELNAVIGLSGLKRLDYACAKRTANLVTFLNRLSKERYRTHYKLEGSSNYALPLVLQEPSDALMQGVVSKLRELGVECRRGTAGGGNQLRQPYAKERWGDHFHERFPQAEHVHKYGLYIGNYPTLEGWKIEALCETLNSL